MINTVLFLSFCGLLIVLIALSGNSCHAQNNLFDMTQTTLFGSVCHSSLMFWIVCILAVMIQVARNKLWIKNSQATREALKEKRSERRLTPIMVYTLANTSLYILSILVILGGNIIVLFCILLGNIIGVFMSLSEQDADKERMTTALLNIQCRWEKLDNADLLSKEEEKEYQELLHLKEWVQRWLQQTPNIPPLDKRASRLRI